MAVEDAARPGGSGADAPAVAGDVEGGRSPEAPDWIPVSFQLTQEAGVGTPAVGFEASWAVGTGTDKEEAIRRESDDRAWSISVSSSPEIGNSP